MTERVIVTIDGKQIEADKGELLIKAAQDNGTYIPRFCWHPRMNPVGMCRMCLVEIETPRGPLMVTACTNPVNDGMVVDTKNDTVKKAQEGILEFLLANHPLDCPVCDKGGECPLQDQAFAYGPGESRFVEEKRHYEKPIPISDLVLLDRERCILCARCTRFSDEISGDPLIEFKDRGNATQVNTFPDLPFSSYFSGNTVQICPVGALTATTYRFRARPWDLTSVESTCVHCTSGDRIAVHVSQNEVLRFVGVDSDATNHGWLSDRCRFGHEYLRSDERLADPMIRDTTGQLVPVSWSVAIERIGSQLSALIEEFGGAAVGAIGGARGTNEDAYALSKFMRSVIGSNSVDAQLADGIDPRFLAATADRAVINDIDTADTILVWAADLKEEHPTLYLRVRRAAQELGKNLIVIHPRRTGLDDRATHAFTYRPGSGAQVLSRLKSGARPYDEAAALLDAGNVVALVGRTGSTEDPRLSEAVAAHVRSLPDSKVLPLVRRSNVYGALDMGLAPTLLPGRVSISSPDESLADAWGELPAAPGRDTRAMLEALRDGEMKAVFLVGADPVRDFPDNELAAAALEAAELTVAIDLFLTDSSVLADVVLPAEGFTEKEGTVTNVEGRVQKVNRVVPGPGKSRPDWSILDDIARRLGTELGLSSAEAVAGEIANLAPAYAGVTWESLEWGDPDGIVVPTDEGHQPLVHVPVDTPGSMEAGDMVLHHARVLYDDSITVRLGPSLAALAPGAVAHVHPDDIKRLGLSDRVTVRTATAEATMPLTADDGLARGTVYIPANQPDMPHLGDHPEVEVTPA